MAWSQRLGNQEGLVTGYLRKWSIQHSRNCAIFFIMRRAKFCRKWSRKYLIVVLFVLFFSFRPTPSLASSPLPQLFPLSSWPVPYSETLTCRKWYPCHLKAEKERILHGLYTLICPRFPCADGTGWRCRWCRYWRFSWLIEDVSFIIVINKSTLHFILDIIIRR